MGTGKAKKTSKKKFIIFSVVAGILLVSIAVATLPPLKKYRLLAGNMIKIRLAQHDFTGRNSGSSAAHLTDLSNKRILMGNSHHVFVARVIEEVSRISPYAFEQRQYKAEVIYNIKGNLKEEIIIEQDEGSLETGRDGEKPWLIPGNTYLLTTRYNKKNDWHHVGLYPFAMTLISSDQNLTSSQLKVKSIDTERVRDLQEAYKEEILPVRDIMNDRIYNSYQSLAAEQKSALEAYWRGDIESLDEPILQPAPEEPEEVPEEPEEPAEQPSEYYGY